MSYPNVQTRSYWHANNLTFRSPYSKTAGASLWDFAPQLAALDPAAYTLYFDDFFEYDGGALGNWADVFASTGTAVVGDGANGIVNILTAATDNDSSVLSSIAESWLFAAAKPLWFEAGLTLTEANVDDANIAIGLSDVVDATILTANGAGPPATYDGAVWCKVDGGTVWQFETSNAAAQVNTASAGAFTDGVFTRLGFIFDPADGTTGSITPFYNGVAGTAHAITLAGLAEMHIVLAVQAGDTNVETLIMDYVKVVAVR
jgi:hypothetical protein